VGQSVRERLAQARAHARRGELSQAEALYVGVLAEQPGFADVHNELGLLFHEQGQFERAEAEFRRALEVNPRYTEAALHLAIVQNDVGQYDEARAAYSQVADLARSGAQGLDPLVAGKIANLHADVGDAYVAAGLPKRAVAAYREALTLGPAFHDIRLKVAQVLQDAGDGAEAIHELEQVVAAAPDLLAAQVALGLARFSTGDKPGAIATWRAVLVKAPADKRAAMYLRLAGETP
jgi:tetratricopeptide (TPR) repeat protein